MDNGYYYSTARADAEEIGPSPGWPIDHQLVSPDVRDYLCGLINLIREFADGLAFLKVPDAEIDRLIERQLIAIKAAKVRVPDLFTCDENVGAYGDGWLNEYSDDDARFVHAIEVIARENPRFEAEMNETDTKSAVTAMVSFFNMRKERVQEKAKPRYVPPEPKQEIKQEPARIHRNGTAVATSVVVDTKEVDTVIERQPKILATIVPKHPLMGVKFKKPRGRYTYEVTRVMEAYGKVELTINSTSATKSIVEMSELDDATKYVRLP